ncbi:MAG: cysteine-rich CWC family protein [Rhodocyclaceae bacterium]|nr:cysteine-rich CWC family protein [Rhodocyclaceae bacterium]MCC6879909.1 cysteine-rich CWC family protein [Rhodocyclaceae bacterium]MCL4681951.1 cysteine-rich CWC family protein [Rhodocyclaceae bacterium]
MDINRSESIACGAKPVCPGCGRAFVCGLEAGWERCWCADLPPLALPPSAGKGCYCPECLKRLLTGGTVKPSGASTAT